MAENTEISWAHATFNPWVGCTKVSEACRHCYAERDFDHRKGFAKWGPSGTRVVTSDANWKKPLAWNRAAEKAGRRTRVFCASLADVFEGPETMPAAAVPVVNEARARLFALIQDTPHLDWLLLTKRPENFAKVLRAALDTGKLRISETKRGPKHWNMVDWLHGRVAPPNVFVGTSVENQDATARIYRLNDIPAVVRFLSMEPLLGPVDLVKGAGWGAGIHGHLTYTNDRGPTDRHIDWVIVGGESGSEARPTHPDWVRKLRDQCVAHKIPFHFKQWGEYLPDADVFAPTGKPELSASTRRGLPKTIPLTMVGETQMARVGKKAAGRELDGRTWDEFPEVRG